MPAKKSLIYFTASLILSVSILAWLFTSLSVSEIIDIIRNADRSAIWCFVALSLATSLFRMLRYRLLLKLSGQKPSSFPLFLVVLVRNLFSDLLPARIGSLIYIYIANARLGVTLSSATSSFTLSLFFDILAIAPIALYAAFSSLSSEGLLSGSNLVAGALVIAAGSVTAIHFFPCCLSGIAELLKKIAAPRPRFFLQRCVSLIEEVQSELLRVRTARVYAKVFALSIAVRLGKYLALYALFLALLVPRGYSLQQLAFSRVFPGLCAAELAASLPVSGIAGLGAYQGAWIFTFTLLGFPKDIAMLTSLAHHLFTQGWGYSLGVLALIVLLLPLRRRCGASLNAPEI